MKFSEQWLREWVDPPLSSEALGERLTLAGLELDSITPAAPAFSGVVVARVTSIAPHPDADRLTVCQVDDGSGKSPQVVCGAPDVREGLLAPFARPGAVLPAGRAVEPASVRGVKSRGMLCSAKDLGLAETAGGLMTLPDDAPVGRDLRDYLGLDDIILELDLTPNRADCLSIAGLARETSALTGAAMKTPCIDAIGPVTERRFDVEIQAPEACPRYVGRVIEDIDPSADTPLWMRERLRRSGLRSLGPVIDVTNYVMLELGQPLHAFDLARLAGGIRVRMASQEEPLVLLDGRTATLDSETLVISDHRRALAMAGVMGGQASAVGADTRDVFLESAFFAPRVIAGRARRYGIATESAHRFERGVDPQLQALAAERATALLLNIAGGRPGPIMDRVDERHLPLKSPIVLRSAQINRLLGIKVPASEVAGILRALGCMLQTAGDEQWRVTPPASRFDLEIEADLIEEVARVYGYDRIPASSQALSPAIRQQAESPRWRKILVDRGYHEAITFSFVDSEMNALFAPEQTPKRLANPISSEMTIMRSSLWPGLIKALQYNLSRQQPRVRLFETGLRFLDTDKGLQQQPMLAGVVTGGVLPEQWGVPARAADFYDVKGDIEAILKSAGLLSRAELEPRAHPALHPGQSAAIRLRGRIAGWLGALHPAAEQTLELGQRVYLFELEQHWLEHAPAPRYKPLSRFPAMRRDIAVVVDESVAAAEIRRAIESLGIEQLREFHLFDVYRGKAIDKGLKSLALGLIFQELSRTLMDQEVEDLVSRITSRLVSEFGASLRE